jgi:hypothetical protein
VKLWWASAPNTPTAILGDSGIAGQFTDGTYTVNLCLPVSSCAGYFTGGVGSTVYISGPTHGVYALGSIRSDVGFYENGNGPFVKKTQVVLDGGSNPITLTYLGI